jgi:hypothetical protein
VVTATYAPPRYHLVPHFTESRADDVFEMAERVGFELDPWQRLVVEGACGVRHDGKWAAKRAAVNVPRQNGKGGILELIELTSLFVWLAELDVADPLAIHSAHEFVTSQKHSKRLWSLIERTPELLRQVHKQRMIGTHGQEAVRLVDGRALEFRSRTKSAGRGFSCDLLVLDEAMFLSRDEMGAIFPTMRARPNPQVWYAGSAVDQEVHNEGYVFTQVRIDGIEREPDLFYAEWSLPYDHPNEIPEDEFDAESSMFTSNPAYGIRIFREHFEMELQALDRRTAAVELYGVGDYPDPTGEEDRPISVEAWMRCLYSESRIVGPVCFGFDVSPERRTSIAVAGRNQDGNWHIEVIEKLPGTGWLPSRLYELAAEHSPEAIVCDKAGPGASLVGKLEDLGVTMTLLDGPEHAHACSRLVDAVNEDNLRHLGSLDLLNAIRAASTRQLGDRWLWSRRNSTVDISPLVAATLALSAAMGVPDGAGDLDIY